MQQSMTLSIKRGLTFAHIPSRLEPTGLMRSDGKRPDGATLAPWKSGCLLVWDATSPDALAASYRVHATSMPGKVAEAAEEKEIEKYENLPPGHFFVPIAIETRGAIGPISLALLNKLGNRIRGKTGEAKLTD